jgi:V/A-type H+-transporting ATPase subunit B
MMNLQVNLALESALDLGWKMLAECFEKHEVGIKQSLIDKYWPR